MKARIFYRMEQLPDPWNAERRMGGNEVWCLVKVTEPEYGDTITQPVAAFNLDSEALMFQGEILIEGYDRLIEVPLPVKESFKRGLTTL